ncbi:hypothetical protein HR060_00660 [Catenovulum sp. SM1970]|uniref:hypothetical protein n=1 Tax=Marinifaba aquimaris TaxID=2741323 RepID=UPI00157458AA|nr:hypothetical protein [Marinifaba aquimaris]NTS75360.1 hypothetical protein [Marinifaba aquimaris]
MNKVVYVVHCIDTEGPLNETLDATFTRLKEIFNISLPASEENLKKIQNCQLDLGGIEKEVAKVFAPHLLDYNRDWADVSSMLDKIMSKTFRERYLDSNGRGWLYNWHCLDFIGFTENPRHRDQRDHAVFDFYSQRDDLFDDQIEFHHHPVGFYKVGTSPATNYLSQNPVIFEIIAKKIIERSWFPTVYRPGFHTTRPDSHWFLEQYIPFEYANQAQSVSDFDQQLDLANGRFGDWRRAPLDWAPYHPSHDDYQIPGHCRRAIARCLNIGTRLRLLSASDVEQAFEEANSGKPVILSFTNHDFRDMSPDIDYVYRLISEAKKKYPEVDFVYSSGKDAMRKALSLNEIPPLDFSLKVTNNQLNVSSNHPVFGPQPFLAIKTKDGQYIHDNFDFDKPFNQWKYTFDDCTVKKSDIEKVGVAANDKYGNSQVCLIDFTTNQTWKENR